ncbi:MAG: hypothetical protein GXY64_06140 [Bacteroidales bacterium]|nr:hypothetical protein [Bacteroidales bacterium]
MKKIFYAIAILATVTFTACDGTAKGGDNTDSINADSIVIGSIEEVEADADATISALTTAVNEQNAEETQTLLEKAQNYIAMLQKAGKIQEAKVYISKIQQFITENKQNIAQFTSGNETISSLVSAVEAIPVDAGVLVEDTKDAVVGAASDVANQAQESVQEKANEVKNAANDAANKAVDDAKQKTSKGIDDAANAVKGTLGLQ